MKTLIKDTRKCEVLETIIDQNVKTPIEDTRKCKVLKAITDHDVKNID